MKMTAAWSNCSILLYICVLLTYLNDAEAHGYLSSPRSRNFRASVEGTYGNEDGVPTKEYCPHCLNRKAANESCGIGSNGSYDDPKDSNGNPMPWITQATYNEGENIFVGGTLTTNHAGHIEMYACPDYLNHSPQCFLDNPLTMVEDVMHNGPNDDTYPIRGYVSPAYEFGFLYKLPDGVRGNKVLLQWKYVTANSCHPPGYRDITLPNGWLRGPDLPSCGPPDPTGVALPEQFWNCAEVTILATGPTPPTTTPLTNPPTVTRPTTSPTTPLTNPPTATRPTTQPTPKSPTIATPPTSTPTRAPNPPSPSTGYCTWAGWCDGTSDDIWCSTSKENCDNCGGGLWCDASSPTPAPQFGYCSWSTPICNGIDPDPGGWCSATKERCAACGGGTWCATGPREPTTNAPTPSSVPKVATTTRYWDCSGGACGCAYLPFAGDNQRPAHCHSNAMFEAPEGNSHGAKFYGTAAISEALGGGNWLAPGCGKCWKVTGTSNAPGHTGIATTLVLKGVNFCPPGNTLCKNNPHFDIAAPGFDVTEFSFSNSCSEREADEEVGFASCGRWMIDSQNPDENCDCGLFKSEVLRVGCENFLSLWWDNSPVLYDEVECPTELSRLNCWEENGNGYPEGIPEFCANNDLNPGTTPTQTPTKHPSSAPTGGPTSAPTTSPASTPTAFQTNTPTAPPTSMPTTTPTSTPNSSPTSLAPVSPTGSPTSCSAEAIVKYEKRMKTAQRKFKKKKIQCKKKKPAGKKKCLKNARKMKKKQVAAAKRKLAQDIQNCN